MTALISVEATMSTADPYAYYASVKERGSHAGAGAFTGAPGLVPGEVFFVPRSQEYYWTQTWQAQERESMDAYARGEFHRYSSFEDFESAILGGAE